MRQRKPAWHITKLLLLALLTTSSVLLIGGCSPRNSPPIIVLDSDKILLVGQGETVTAPWPAILLSRGRYLKLVDAEMALLQGPAADRAQP